MKKGTTKKGTAAKLVGCGLLALAGVSAWASVWAQEERRPWYVGGALGSAHARSLCDQKGSLSCDQRAGAWSIFAGYRFNPYLAVEGGRTRPGTFNIAGSSGGTPTNASFDTKLWDVVAVGSYPVVHDLLVYGKAGAYTGTSSFSGRVGAFGFSGESSPSNWTVGLGAELNTRPIALRAEWQRFHHVTGGTSNGVIVEPGDLDVLSLGVLYKF